MNSKDVWGVALRVIAALLAVAIGVSYVMPDGIARAVSFIAIPILIVAFIEIRRKAGRVPEKEDQPWNG